MLENQQRYRKAFFSYDMEPVWSNIFVQAYIDVCVNVRWLINYSFVHSYTYILMVIALEVLRIFRSGPNISTKRVDL